MKIIVVGVGYVGLVTGVMLSDFGHTVICIDNDKEKIDKLNNNILPIYERGLQEYLEFNLARGKLHFITKYNDMCRDADVAFITVGTPSNADGSVDLSYVMQAAEDLVKFISPECLIVLKSTVPPGTCIKLKQHLANIGDNFEVASNPEFLREGTAVTDFLKSDRIIVGVSNVDAEEKFKEIYKKLINDNIPLIITKQNTSELIKYASNAFLALKLAFINEMSDLCEKVEADIDELALGIGADKRIGKEFLKVGPGFGGSCFPKDINGLLKVAEKHNTNRFLLEALIESNNARPKNMVKKIQNILGEDLTDKKLCVLGLTFKANTDDIRESPAIEIVKLLLDLKANIRAYDPEGMENAKKLNLRLTYVNSINEGINGADAALILTEWDEFKHLDLSYAYNHMHKPTIIDFRNILNAEILQNKGFKYYQLGKIYIKHIVMIK